MYGAVSVIPSDVVVACTGNIKRAEAPQVQMPQLSPEGDKTRRRTVRKKELVGCSCEYHAVMSDNLEMDEENHRTFRLSGDHAAER